MNVEDSINEIIRKYLEKRSKITELYQYKFNTPNNIKNMNHQIKECDDEYKNEIRQKKIEIILNKKISKF
jgi:phenylalanyl-tRNA synthetase alpha subunit